MHRPHSLFISHKTGEGPLAGLRDALLAELKPHHDNNKLIVRIDLLEPKGQEFWNRNKDQYLAEASAAIFLLDERALASEWVKHEIHVLRHHGVLSPDRTLLPVLAPGITRQSLSNHPAVVVAGLNNHTPIEAADRPHQEIIAEIFKALDVATLLTFEPDDELESWIERVQNLLPEDREGDLTIRALRAIFGTADEEPRWRAITWTSRRRRLAQALVVATELKRLRDALDALADAHIPSAGKLGGLLTPLWVSNALAGQLRTHATQPQEPSPAIVLSARYNETGFEVVRRAFRCAPIYHWAPEVAKATPPESRYLNTSESGFSDFRECLERRILECGGDLGGSDDDYEERIDECLAELTSDSTHPAIAPLRQRDYDEQYRARYKGLVFLILRDFHEPAAGAGFIAMQPDLTRDEETNGRKYVRHVQSLFPN